MIRSFCLALVGTVVANTAVGQAPAAKPDLAKAQQVVTQICAACHGADGNSMIAANPSLAGQHAQYTARQLRHFKEGVRKNEIMAPMAATLTPQDIDAIGVYFAQQKAKGVGSRNIDLVRIGERLYRGGDMARGLPACAGCHSATGAGIPANYPRLSGQYAEYTYAQLKAFKEEKRGMDKDGKDVHGRTMVPIAARMTDREMQAVADYIAGLR